MGKGMKNATEQQQLHLRVLVFFGRTKWVAQCLEYDIAVQAKTPEELEAHFAGALEAERRLSEKLGQEPFTRLPRAPRRYWDAWHKAFERQQREHETAEPWRNIPAFITSVESIRVQGAARQGLGLEHPWEVTLEELVAMVRKERGDEYADLLALLGEMRPDLNAFDILEPEVSRALLLRVGLDPRDFGHDPYQPDARQIEAAPAGGESTRRSLADQRSRPSLDYDAGQKLCADKEAAREFIEQVRWGGTPVCPHCGHEGAYKLESKPDSDKPVRPGVYKCSDTRKQFTVTVGTMFEGV